MLIVVIVFDVVGFLSSIDAVMSTRTSQGAIAWAVSAYSYFEEAQATGIRFFHYTDGFLHQKVVLIDDAISAVGTANFDNRSFRLNFEVMAMVADRGFATEIEQMLLADMEDCVDMQPGALAKKSYWFRLGTQLARLTAPIQ